MWRKILCTLSGQRGLLLLTDIFFPHRTRPLGISVDGDCVGNGIAEGRVSGQVAANREEKLQDMEAAESAGGWGQAEPHHRLTGDHQLSQDEVGL